MSRSVTIPALITCLLLALPSFAADKAAAKKSAGKEGKEVVSTSKTASGKDKDPNIKMAAMKNDKKKVAEAPPEKGGKARGDGPGSCRVVIDNWTGYIIQAFVDGDFVGTVSRFGDGHMYVGSGATLFYARAEFDDGSVLTWGPQALDCEAGGATTWKLK
jgi:hypothetical protein